MKHDRSKPTATHRKDEKRVGEFQGGVVYEVGHVGSPANHRPFLVTRSKDGGVMSKKKIVRMSDADLLSMLGLSTNQEHVLRALQPRTSRITLSLLQQIKALQDEGREPTHEEAADLLQLISQLNSEVGSHLDGEADVYEYAESADITAALQSAMDGLAGLKDSLYQVPEDADALPAGLMEHIQKVKSALEDAAHMVGVEVVEEEAEGAEASEESDDTDEYQGAADEQVPPQEPDTNPEKGADEQPPASTEEEEVDDEDADTSDDDTAASEEEVSGEEPEVTSEEGGAVAVPVEPESPDSEPVQRAKARLERFHCIHREMATLIEQMDELLLELDELAPTEPLQAEGAGPEGEQPVKRNDDEQATAPPPGPSMDDFRAMLQETITPLTQQIERLEASSQEAAARLEAIERQSAEASAQVTERLDKVERQWNELDNFHPGSRGGADAETVHRQDEGSNPNKVSWGNVLFGPGKQG